MIPTLQDIYLARQRIGDMARRTPTIRSETLSDRLQGPVYLKLENLQVTGSFKVRGAASKIGALTPEQREAGVIAVSTGNHGRAVSHVARQFGVQAVVCLSTGVPANKVQAIERLGAQVDLSSESQDRAFERADEIREERGLTMIPPFDDGEVVAGQGTIGLELLEDLPELATVVVPLSGGGLLGGIALALKNADAGIRIIGASMERGAAMYASLKAGEPVEVVEEETLADSLLGGIGHDNRLTLRLIDEYVDDVVLVSEEEIGWAMAFALEEHHLVLEGAAAVAIAGVLKAGARASKEPTALVLSGGNVDIEHLIGVWQQFREQLR